MKSKQRLNRRGHRYIRSFQLYQDTEAPGAVADLLKVGNHRAQSFVENLLEVLLGRRQGQPDVSLRATRNQMPRARQRAGWMQECHQTVPDLAEDSRHGCANS